MLCTLGPHAGAETPAATADKAAESPQQSPDLVNTQKLDSVSTGEALPDDNHAEPSFEAGVPLRESHKY